MRLAAPVGGRNGLDKHGEDQEAGLRLRRPYGHGDVVSALLFAVNEYPAVGSDTCNEQGEEKNSQSKAG